ncbi:MAG: AAA family ATPase [Patescibacteria group bacterium]|nr:AAA family ATPase [Patescibacteria group bacterium]
MKLPALEILEEAEVSRYLVDQWFSVQGVHLVAGPSGTGKTRWLLKLIEAWQRGESVFGHASHPVPFVYIAADRGRRDAFATMYGIKMNPKTWPLVAHDDVPHIETAQQIIKRALLYFPAAKVFVIEGLASLMPGGGDKAMANGAVQKFLKDLGKFNKSTDSTVIGTVHTTKAKSDSVYEIAREKIMGASAWGAYSNTIVYLEYANANDPVNPERRITVLPRNAPVETFYMRFNGEGLLERIEEPTGGREYKNPVFKEFLASLADDQEEFSTADVVRYLAAGDSPQSRTTAKRAIIRAEQNEEIIRMGRGRFKINRPDVLDVHRNTEDNE